MMPARTWKIFLRAIRVLPRFPLRSGLTVLSGVFGIAGALTSVNFALGGRAKVTNQLGRLGTNLLTVTPVQSRSVGGRARTGAPVTTLTLTDYQAIRRDVPLFSHTSAFSLGTDLIKAGDLAKKGCVVVGIEPDYLLIKQWTLQNGTAFQASDLRRMARLVLLGSAVARDLFASASPIGQRVFINRVPFEVVGVLSERGQSLDAANEDDQLYIPITTATHRLTNLDYLSGMLLEVNRWEQMDEAARQTTALLTLRHNRQRRLPPDFQLQNQKQLLDTQLAASEKLLRFVRWIAVSALCVSGLGILAISWIGVRERTGEIGTQRAIGATKSDIFLQFLSEACVLSFLGCCVGTFLAWQISHILAGWAEQPQVFDKPSAWTAVAAASLLNIAFAILPASSAASLDPIRALRFE